MSELNRDFYKDEASKMFGIPYEDVTDEQRAEAKKRVMCCIYGRRKGSLNEIISE